MTEAELVKTKDGLFLVIDGTTELMRDHDGNWLGKDGWTVQPTKLLDANGDKFWEGIEFRHNGELLDWRAGYLI